VRLAQPLSIITARKNMNRIDLLFVADVYIRALTNICIVQNTGKSRMTMVGRRMQVHLCAQTIFLGTIDGKNLVSFFTPRIVCWNINKQIYQ
jgi:hypothetical protein